MDTIRSDLMEKVGELVVRILEDEVPSPHRRTEVLGDVWQDCHEAVREQPELYARAQDDRELRALLQPQVRSTLNAPDTSGRGATLRSGCLGTFIDPQLRELAAADADPASREGAAEELEIRLHPLVDDALELARSDGNGVLTRNLCWMLERDRGHSYDAIAAAADSPAASVRTGVRRARQAVRRIAQEKRRAVNAPHQGECPEALRPARDAWKRGDLEALARGLDAAEASLAEHPYFWFLSALLADDSGERERAVALFRRVLLDDDDPKLRAKVLNCLGYIADDQAERGRAHALWSRSVQIDPHHTPAQVNLLKSACDRRDKLDVHVCIDRIGGLLTSRSLRAADREYLIMRLREHPDFGWARSFDAWSKGPARWIARLERQSSAGPGAAPGRSRAVALGLLLGLSLGLALLAWDAGPRSELSATQSTQQPTQPPILEMHRERAPQLAHSGDRGGHRPRPDRYRAIG